MRPSTLLTCAALTCLAYCDNQNHEAPVIKDNPAGVAYKATLPDRPDTSVRGSVVGAASPGGEGIDFTVALEGLPQAAGAGPFLYHIHDQPVSSDGNCTSTLAHLDPYERGETPPCDKNKPWTCQVGDLSGKHGLIDTTVNQTGTFTASYKELYVDANLGRGSFFGNRSITIHFNNKTRLTCANFTQFGTSETMGPWYLPNGTTSNNATSTGLKPTGAVSTTGAPPGYPPPSKPTSNPQQFPGSAQKTFISVGGILGVAFAATMIFL